MFRPVDDRIAATADLARAWVRLRRTPSRERRVAIVLANYPNRDGRLANGVGLDTPQSLIDVLGAMRGAGYAVDDVPRRCRGDDAAACRRARPTCWKSAARVRAAWRGA